MSLFLPRFLQELSDPSINSVLLTGCGGGFDFVHSMTMIPELRRMKKNYIIGSYSFGQPQEIEAEVIFSALNSTVIAKKVYASSLCSQFYCPEVAICQFLDKEFPEDSPHFVYAYYARDFSVKILKDLHKWIIQQHSIDAILLFDGGSDSLMKGDENGLGDPIEDAVSVAAVAEAEVKFKVLISIGVGCDRYNDVSDRSTLRAISEISKLGGFLGSISLEKGNPTLEFYRKCLEFIYTKQDFRSVLAGSIVAAADGYFGDSDIPASVIGRVNKGSLFIWPLMSMLWAFDVNVVDQRSLITKWIRLAETSKNSYQVLEYRRNELYGMSKILDIEELPLQRDYSYSGVLNREELQDKSKKGKKCECQ